MEVFNRTPGRLTRVPTEHEDECAPAPGWTYRRQRQIVVYVKGVVFLYVLLFFY
jgi:hypothetical protein